MGDIVYLDVCCFKRPFDDGTQPRIRREAEAVAAVLEAASAGGLRLVRSPAHDLENDRNPREDRRLATRLWLAEAVVEVSREQRTVARTAEPAGLGFSPLDSAHLAFAEQAAARWFVTTDDRLLKRARSRRDQLHVEVIVPGEVPLPAREDPGEQP